VTARRECASVLILVLWISIGLVSIALYFANSMTYELRASDNRSSGLVAEQAIEGAARYVSSVLTTYATNGVVPLPTQFACEAVAVGEARFWLIGRDPVPTGGPEPYFSLIDEGAKLNLNRAGSNTLSYLPNMTTDFAQAIIDWRGTNVSLSLSYAEYGYSAKHAPFETLDELRLVEGATIDLLIGDDVNRNGVLDASEESAISLFSETGGLFDYVTVYSREPNFHADGSALTNVNNQNDLRSLLQTAMGASRAQQILQNLGFSPGQQGPPPNFTTLLQFYNASQMTETELTKIYNDLTTRDTNTLFTTGRVNLNTASEPVMTALFMGIGIEQNTVLGAASSLISYREQHPDNLTTIAWVVNALGKNNQVLRALETRDLVTTRSYQFLADIAAVGPLGRGYRRVKFIFDTSETTPKIIYRQELSRLGWALGENARHTYVALDTK
jgi:DNA uptake protein ComE-like DNA-binding protein